MHRMRDQCGASWRTLVRPCDAGRIGVWDRSGRTALASRRGLRCRYPRGAAYATALAERDMVEGLPVPPRSGNPPLGRTIGAFIKCLHSGTYSYSNQDVITRYMR